MEKQALLNTYINNVTMPETIAAIEKMIADNKKSYVVAINVDVVMKIENDPYLKQVVDNADMVLVDGKPLLWISKLHGKPLKAKISGSDLVPLLCDVAAKKGYSIFIIGGKDPRDVFLLNKYYWKNAGCPIPYSYDVKEFCTHYRKMRECEIKNSNDNVLRIHAVFF